MAAITGGGTPSSGAWPAANDAIFVPFYIQQFTNVTRLYVVNGTAASGNMDVGIYNGDGTLIISSGSTAQSGTNQPQFFNIADTMLAPGDYYIACSIDGTGGTVFRSNLSVIRMQEGGCAKATSAMPLPAIATLVASTSGLYPLMGIEIAPGRLF